MEEITSAKNPLIKRMRSLSGRAPREEMGLIPVEGEVMIREALACGLKLREAIGIREKESFLGELPCSAHIVPESLLQAVSDTKTPQGVFAAFETPAPVTADSLPNRIVALDGVQDPGNVGTIWRTADAAGIQAVLFGDGCADAMSPKVLRSSMGSAFRVSYAQENDLAFALSHLRKKEYLVICSALDGQDFYTLGNPGERFALVIGNEARGISDAVRAQATNLVKLPMRGGAESLNAAVAAGIMMYELMRMRAL